jgi:hypothetical protein
MSDGWRSSEKDTHVAKSPWANQDGGEDDNTSSITRAGYGDMVAPLAQNMKPVDNSPGGSDPNANGNNGRSPWRAGYGGAGGVAPSAQRLPIDASSPDQVGTQANTQWRAGYPESSYKGPGTSATANPNPSPWTSSGNASTQWRAGYPDSSYKGPDTTQQPANTTPDWSTYARQQQQIAQQTQPSRSDAPGVPSNPGLNGVTDDQRKYIENSLHLKTSMAGYLGTGAITGASIGAAEWYMDRKLLQTMGQPHSGVLGWWETHSPVLKEQSGLTSRLTELQGLHAAKSAELAVAEQSLANQARDLNSILGGLNTRAAGMAADDAAAGLLAKQRSFIADAGLRSNPAELAKVIGTPEEVAAGAKLFAKDSAEASTLLNLADASKAKSAADLAIKTAAKDVDKTQTLLSQSVEEGAGSLGGRTWKGAVKGLAVAGGTLALGYGMDKLGASIFGYKQPETDGMGRFLLDGVAVPAVLLSDLPARYKFALAGTAFLSARAADYFKGTGASVQMSTLLRPNTCDGVLMTAAAMAPVDGKTKAALIAGAWGVGRVYNEVAHLTGLDGGAPAQLRDDFQSSVSHDQLTRTESTFDSAVKKGAKLGKENEAALELEMRDWMSKQSSTNPLTFARTTAIISASLGQFRLEEGSRLDLTSHADKKPRILKGSDYDFGGEATTWLRMSAGSLVQAQNFVMSHKGQTVDGQTMDDNYVQQLKNEQTKVEAKLNVVYGKHDMQGIYEEMTKQARVNSGDMQQGLVRMKNQLDVLNSNDSRFVAKCCRDMAIGYLAEANYMTSKNNGEEARIMFQAAVQYLQRSEQLDKSAPDNEAIEKIQASLAKSIPGAVANQYNSNWNNPFQLKTPSYAQPGNTYLRQ